MLRVILPVPPFRDFRCYYFLLRRPISRFSYFLVFIFWDCSVAARHHSPPHSRMGRLFTALGVYLVRTHTNILIRREVTIFSGWKVNFLWAELFSKRSLEDYSSIL